MGPPLVHEGPVANTSADLSTWSPRTDGPPQISTLPFQPQSQSEAPAQQTPTSSSGLYSPSSHLQSSVSSTGPAVATHLAPLKPVFGLSLDDLFDRDGSAVPMIVYQCIQAVDLFGLEVEGIYRLSGTASHITKIKAMFDNGKFRPCHGCLTAC
jgi:hypothetical protein